MPAQSVSVCGIPDLRQESAPGGGAWILWKLLEVAAGNHEADSGVSLNSSRNRMRKTWCYAFLVRLFIPACLICCV